VTQSHRTVKYFKAVNTVYTEIFKLCWARAMLNYTNIKGQS